MVLINFKQEGKDPAVSFFEKIIVNNCVKRKVLS